MWAPAEKPSSVSDAKCRGAAVGSQPRVPPGFGSIKGATAAPTDIGAGPGATGEAAEIAALPSVERAARQTVGSTTAPTNSGGESGAASESNDFVLKNLLKGAGKCCSLTDQFVFIALHFVAFGLTLMHLLHA